MGSVSITNKPHAVCIPFPAQGHINPMLKLAKLLHHKDFHITFINTEFNHKRILKSRGPGSVKGLADFQFETIPDGLPVSDVEATQDIPTLCDSTRTTCLVPFHNLLNKLNNNISYPSVSCVISDGAMTFTLDAAKELCVPEVLFWTTSACGFMGYLHFPQLIQRGTIPFKGVKKMRLKDLPSFLRTTDPEDLMLNVIIGEVGRANEASAIILNTFDVIEYDVLKLMKALLPSIYTIGSLHMLLQHIPNNELRFIGSNLWKEEAECLKWLDSKENNSVVYVNFGSITVTTPQQLVEFAWGLSNSKQTFLWVIRPDLVVGDSAILPPEFLTEMKERGMLSSWCPQEDVLNHASIGGFLTHSGWNSTLESICSAVPMICWPFFAEQQTNCRYCCVHWGIGMEIDNDVKRGEVESLVKELMEGEKGKEMKMKAMDWKIKAKEASVPGGSSYENLDKLIGEIFITK
ncbi:hypothetical protein GIB67_023107 [Kingdonia uniflora]|uniref:Glycosyltransferase n=1 Tax=Kingdonia uniflora TaxID=39325 RepID=A0A7J7M5P0_9MAGN|nr:hypothetical protein GIB67_023107 [Kingdonia uniflora]